MTAVAIVIFWLFAAIVCYVYLLYPVLVRTLALVAGRRVRCRSGYLPTVTVLITAYNEEKSLASKLDNVLAVNYPAERLNVIVVSDASSDGTDELVQAYNKAQRVRLLRVEGRRGKTACQNAGVSQATGEIVVFTDATTRIQPDAIRAMMENFADPEVGCVAGTLVYLGKEQNLTAAGGLSYWNYEVALRSAESRLGTLIGVSGCLYAVRRSVYCPIAPDLISDFVIAMRMRDQGLRTVLERRAVCYEGTLERSRQELSMRVRVALRSINAIVSERRFLNPFRDPAFAWRLWSHKLLRYATPYCLLLVLAASVVLDREPFYRLALLAQGLLVVVGITGFVLRGRLGLLTKPYYFLLTNLASIIATVRYLRGERIVTWNPVR